MQLRMCEVVPQPTEFAERTEFCQAMHLGPSKFLGPFLDLAGYASLATLQLGLDFCLDGSVGSGTVQIGLYEFDKKTLQEVECRENGTARECSLLRSGALSSIGQGMLGSFASKSHSVCQ